MRERIILRLAGFASTIFVVALVALFATVTSVNFGHAEETLRSEHVAKIEKAIAAGAGFLVEQQQPDGTWRSKTYGLLKDGTSLTPLVIWSLPKSALTRAAQERGLAAMSSWVESEARTTHVRVLPQYPVYAAGLAIIVLSESEEARQKDETVVWRGLLKAHQLTETNGWSQDDSRFGGWGYSHDPPTRPADGATLSPLDEPNLSATVFALEGLAAGHRDDPPMKVRLSKALQFVQRCQNWRANAPAADEKFNDGGFHFLLIDEVRNKPGVAGVDGTGQTRFVSYGSATADGLRALLLCGVKRDHPRVVAARLWLVRHLEDGAHPGAYPADRAHLQPSLDFYYAASLSKAFRQLQTGDARHSNSRWATLVASRLLTLQRHDGSWSNPAVDVREDDPLIATSFALFALRNCLDELRSYSGGTAPGTGDPGREH